MEKESSSPVVQPQPTTLLSLPQELRDLIMDRLILKPDNTITMLPNFNCHKEEISACSPPICSVNRQLRAECLPRFFSQNTFTAQLDMEEDLEVSKAWLAAIGDSNVRHLRKLACCGWTRILFGHMVTRRWVKVVFDLREGEMEVVQREADLKAGPNYSLAVMSTVEELKTVFRELVDAREGTNWDEKSLAELMDGFHGICTGY